MSKDSLSATLHDFLAGWQVELVFVAVLLALLMMLADALLFVAPSWDAHGRADLEATGKVDLAQSPGRLAQLCIVFTLRCAAAILVATLYGMATGVLIFAKDISSIVEAKYQVVNALLVSEKKVEVAGSLDGEAARLAQLRARIAPIDQEMRQLRNGSVDPNPDEPELKLALDGLAQARTNKTAADAALRAAEDRSARELGGECFVGGSCIPGNGPRWRAHQERIESARRSVKAADEAFERASVRLREAQERREGEKQRKLASIERRLAELAAQRDALDSELTAATRAYADKQSRREQLIRDAVESDPRYQPRPSGLLVRMQALNELMQDKAVALFVYVLEGVLMFIELSSVIGKAITNIPMAYTVLATEVNIGRNHNVARRLANDINPTEPPPPANGAAAAPEPDPPDPATPRRHAKRWRPGLNGGGDPTPPETPPET